MVVLTSPRADDPTSSCEGGVEPVSGSINGASIDSMGDGGISTRCGIGAGSSPSSEGQSPSMENEQALITKATTNSVAGLTHISIIAKATLFVGARCRVPAVSLSHLY